MLCYSLSVWVHVLMLQFCSLFFQTRHAIEKVLDWENSHLYHKVRKYGLLNIRITWNMLADGKMRANWYG